MNTFILENFIKYLRLAFKDIILQEKAILYLNTLYQENYIFENFVSEFKQLLLETGKHAWNNSIKKSYIKSALSYVIKKKIIALEK